MQVFFTKKPLKMAVLKGFIDIDTVYVNDTTYGAFFERNFLCYSETEAEKKFFIKMFDELRCLCYSV